MKVKILIVLLAALLLIGCGKNENRHLRRLRKRAGDRSQVQYG